MFKNSTSAYRYSNIKYVTNKAVCFILTILLLVSIIPQKTMASSIYTFGTINSKGVNVRHAANGQSFEQLDRGTIVQVLETIKDSKGLTWYGIYLGSSNIGGYVLSKFVDIMPANLAANYATNNPSAVRPGKGPVTSINPIGYVKTTAGGVNLRTSPDGFAVGKVNRNVVFPYVSISKLSDYTWYRVFSNEYGYCYLRGDFATPTSSTGQGTGANIGTSPGNVSSAFGTITLILDKVKLRNTPDANSVWSGTLALGSLLPLLAQPMQSGGYTWYYVETSIGKGYVRGDCASLAGVQPPPYATLPPAENPLISQYGTITLILDNVNVRKTPAVDGFVISKALFSQTLPLLSQPASGGGFTWYHIKTLDNVEGYIRGDCARLNPSIPTQTYQPIQPLPTPIVSFGTIKVKLPAVNLRQTPAGTVIGRVDIGETYQLLSAPVSIGAYAWYQVNVNGLVGYLRGDCVEYIPIEALPPTALLPVYTPTPVIPQGNSNYLITIVDKVNLRKSTSKASSAIFNVPLNTMLEFNRETFVGNSKWYKIAYKGYDLWVLGSCVRVLTAAEYQGISPTQALATPQLNTGYITTIMQKVNVRQKPAGTVVGTIPNSGITMPYLGTETTRTHTWYKINYNNTIAYVRGDCVKITDQAGGSIVTTPAPGTTYPPNTGNVEASYRTIMLGDTGEDVRRMQSELANKGFYNGELNGNFTSAVEQAVLDFQRANGLKVDGIAGPLTLHKLFNTVPVGSGNTNPTPGTGGFTMVYPAKKIDWWTGGIQQLWPKGTNAQLKDVKTGITFWVRRWSGGNHVDGEPLTAADTAKVCQIYGVKDAGEILKQNLWQRRALWVTLNGSTYCCSLYGVPHNVAGDMVPNNNYTGQFCVHFTNSKTHTNNIVDKYHEEAIEYAFKTGQSPQTDKSPK